MFPQIFLDYLADNEIPLVIYERDVEVSRYVCKVPGIVSDPSQDFPSGIEECPEFPLFYHILPPFPENVIQKSVLYKSGRLIAMDLSSGMAVKYLDIREGDHILDLCCAPGTKLTLAGLLTGSTGSVTGIDVAEHRLSVARALVKKYKVSNVRLFHTDGTKFDRRPFIPKIDGCSQEAKCFHSSGAYRKSKGTYDPDGLYDKVLVDTQCTHDGSIKHVIKCQTRGWSTSDLAQYKPDALKALYQLQVKHLYSLLLIVL